MLANILNNYGLITFYFTIAVIVHCISNYYLSWSTIFGRFILIGSITGIILLLELRSYESFTVFISSAIIYAFMCELYIFLFTLVSASISIAILLHGSKEQVNLDLLKTVYGGKAMVEKRITRLEKIKLIKATQNSFSITAKGEKILKYFLGIQNIFNHTSI